MKMQVEITGADGIEASLKGSAKRLARPGLLERLGEAARDAVIERTLSGRDVKGRMFAPYSAAYRRSGSEGSTVDLRDTGRMLANISVATDAEAGTATLYFRDEPEAKKAAWHNSRGVGKERVVRRFFGLSRSDAKMLEDIAAAHVAEVIKDAL